jgi:ABC-type phosphate transport system substrate-binding protein
MMRTVAAALAMLVGNAMVFADDRQVVYRVIVNPSNKVQNLERKYLGDVFLKKATTWASGDAIRPVDLGPDSPVRRKFDQDVLGRSIAAVKNYWQQMIFAGRDVPPPELDRDEDVIAYILKHPNAIGYVSGAASLTSVKVVVVN